MAQSASSNVDPSVYLGDQLQGMMNAYNKLGTDDKLALLYYVYEKMGDSVTPAAPTATEPELAPILMSDFFNLSHNDQLEVMRDIVEGKESEYSHAYGAIKENNQLMVWYAWAQAMGETVIGMPGEYSAPNSVNELLTQIESLDFEQQMTLLREIASNMGYTNVQPVETQAQTGKTPSL